MKLQPHLQAREDFEDLLALGCLFDEANQAVKASLVPLRPRLEDELSCVIPMNSDLSSVCCTNFQERTPQVFGIDGAQYLSHVSVQCQVERLYDLLKLRRSGNNNPLEVQECSEVLKFLMLSEALALSLAGVAKVKRHADGFHLSVCGSIARDALRNTWFARMADQNSRAGTLALAKHLATNGAEHLRDVEGLTIRILEQELSLPWYKISMEGRSLRSVTQIYAATSMVALLTVLSINGKVLKMSGPVLSRHGLDYSFVADLIHRQADALVTDQFLIRRGDILDIRIEGASKGLRQLFRLWETEFNECDALRLYVGGHFYEKTHIRQRIEQGDDYRPRYRVFDGFDRYKVIGDFPNECDIEFIIRDLEQEHYYFIQAKHTLLGEKAFFEAVIEAIQNDIGHGLRQLREAKRLLENGFLNDTLEALGIVDAASDNSSFVLLHNIAQFDFQCTSDGISLYDWATFRNLLKDAECHYGHSDGPSVLVRLPGPLVTSDPTAVIQRLLSEHPAYGQAYIDPWATERATTNYEVLGKTIYVSGLGI